MIRSGMRRLQGILRKDAVGERTDRTVSGALAAAAQQRNHWRDCPGFSDIDSGAELATQATANDNQAVPCLWHSTGDSLAD